MKCLVEFRDIDVNPVTVLGEDYPGKVGKFVRDREELYVTPAFVKQQLDHDHVNHRNLAADTGLYSSLGKKRRVIAGQGSPIGETSELDAGYYSVEEVIPENDHVEPFRRITLYDRSFGLKVPLGGAETRSDARRESGIIFARYLPNLAVRIHVKGAQESVPNSQDLVRISY